jgi:hypothetical protein
VTFNDASGLSFVGTSSTTLCTVLLSLGHRVYTTHIGTHV